MTFWVPYHSSLPVLGLDNLLFANVIIRHLHYIWQPSESDTIHKGFNCMIGMACIVLPLLIMRTCAQPWGWVGAWWSIANHVNLGTNVPSPICKYESNNLFLPTDLSISPCFWTEVKGYFQKHIYTVDFLSVCCIRPNYLQAAPLWGRVRQWRTSEYWKTKLFMILRDIH